MLAQQSKATARCLACQLIQFVTERNQCRRCHVELVLGEMPQPPAPLVLVPAPEKLSIAGTIRALRLEHHLTQRQLAGRMCVARTYISKVEADKCSPTLPLLARFAKGLQVDMSTLLGERNTFIAEITPYIAQLSDSQRSSVLNYARELTR
jgi:transcriptional regulator with XRE-family HTH domain